MPFTDQFKLYVDRLKNGKEEILELQFDSQLLQVDESELHFEGPISVKGKAYVAENHLIIHIDIHTQVSMPCSICNSWTKLPIDVEGCYQTIALSQVEKGTHDYLEDIREAILLEIPQFIECSEGKCPSRTQMKQYLNEDPAKETYFPFADLDKN